MNSGGEDTQAYMDQSILAIFEDTPVASEGRGGVEEDNEKLLSALTEMLDSVEDDDDFTLSPFDTLPDSKLLVHPEPRNISGEPPVANRLRLKLTNETFPLKEENKAENRADKNSIPILLNSRTKKIESELEVFTSASLANLVKLMHPYCLKLHVNEEGAQSRKNHTFFSQEEVWKYERPTEGSDEEINVVSDDEEEAEDPEKREDSVKHLKSALLKSKPSKERKRVSFGPVEVASFDETLTSSHTSEMTCASSCCNSPGSPPELKGNQGEIKLPRSPMKAKALSLQQYRQLRQLRQPLVEKQGNYTTRWPLVPEAPRELTPILCLQGQKLGTGGPKPQQTSDTAVRRSASSGHLIRPTSTRPHPSDHHKPYTPAKYCKLKCPIIESKAPPSTARPPSGATPGCPLATEGKVSPAKTAAAVIISSDPPNPVLLPVPLSQTSLCKDQILLRPSVEPSPTVLQTPGTSVEMPPGDKHNIASLQDVESSTIKVAQRCLTASHFNCSIQSEQLVEALQVKTMLERPLPSQAVSGIEATDLTSLLEQFEETQVQQTGTEVSMELASLSSSSGTSSTPHTLRDSSDLLMIDAAAVPEPLDKEVVLSTQLHLSSARRKNFSSKAIQIIDPRPLPPRKTPVNQLEVPNALASPHLYISVSHDHNYCASTDLFPAGKDSLKVEGSLPKTKYSECTQANSLNEDRTSIATPVCEELAPPTDALLSILHSVDTEQASKSAADHKVVPCDLSSPPARGRDRRRFRRRSPSSSPSSYSSSSPSLSSCSPSPKRRRHKHSESSSCSSSPSRAVSKPPPRSYRLSCSRRRCSRSRSRSRSWSSSRSRSPPTSSNCKKWRDVYNRKSRRLRREHELRIQKLKAIDERRVVYVGRICRSMTHDELRERFSQFGEVECVSLHFRERGDHYAFVTFYDMNNAFAAIDNGSKLRRPDELPFDLCFGGRRQFCNSDYADLDANKETELAPVKSKHEDLDFDQLLKQAQKGMKR